MTLFGTLFRRRREFEHLSAEIRAHLDEKADALVAAGMSRTDAEAAARRAFGNVTRIEEAGRDTWRVPTIDSIASDARHAIRLVRRHPGFGANVVLISALGIFACATTFSVVSGILLAPLPFREPDRVFELAMRSSEGAYTAAVPVDAFLRISAGSPVIEAIAAGSPHDVAVDWGGEPEIVDGRRVTSDFFRVYGVAPILGRAFTAAEAEESAPVVLIGNQLWRSRFDADSSVVGRGVTLNDTIYTVIGVMPPAFRAFYTEEPGFWLPMRVAGTNRAVNAQLRLKDGVDSAVAVTWLRSTVRARMESRTTRDSVAAEPTLTPIAERVSGDVARPLRVLLAAVLLVLVLVAANVSTMHLARTAAREGELGVRRALGATALREGQLLVVESITLSAVGGAIGTLLSYWAVGGIRVLGEGVLPRMDAVALDGRVIAFAAAATTFVGLAGGLVPAVVAARRRSVDASGTRITGTRTSSMLVITQVALSVVLLVGAGLLVKGFLRVLPSSPGFATERRAALLVSLARHRGVAPSDSLASRRFLTDVIDRLRAVRGVTDVAATTFPPFFGSVSRRDVEIPGQPVPDRPLVAYQNMVTSNYFDLMAIPLHQGRAFNASDRDGMPRAAIVNQAAADRWWPNERIVIGRQVMLPGQGRVAVTVVGVSGNTRLFGSDSRPRPEMYLPVEQWNPRYITFIAKTEVDPPLVARDLQRAVWSVAPRLAIGTTTDLESIAMRSVRLQRFYAWAMGAFATAAVVLSALAVHGLLSFAVAQRRREIGIRLAIGATPRAIGAAVFGRAALLGASGAAAGILAARLLSRYMDSLLTEVTATDAQVFAATAAAALAIAVVAACAPAYQALRVDPSETLRTE